MYTYNGLVVTVHKNMLGGWVTIIMTGLHHKSLQRFLLALSCFICHVRFYNPFLPFGCKFEFDTQKFAVGFL